MKIINPDSLSQPRGYNNGIVAEGSVLFVAGQVGWDKDEQMANGLTAQFDRALQNILEIVRAAGGTAQMITRFTIYIKDKQDYIALRREIGQVYQRHMGKHYPAMSLLVVKDLLEDHALIEIEATAVLR